MRTFFCATLVAALSFPLAGLAKTARASREVRGRLKKRGLL